MKKKKGEKKKSKIGENMPLDNGWDLSHNVLFSNS